MCPARGVDNFFLSSSESYAAFVFRGIIWEISFYVGVDFVIVFQGTPNNSIGIIKFFHEILRISNSCLIGTAEVVVQHDKSSKGVVCIDAICRPCPAFHAHFSEVIIIEIIKEVQMLNSSVEAVPDKQAEMIVVFRDVQCAFPLFVWIALLVESLADTSLQNVYVFQWSAQKEI